MDRLDGAIWKEAFSLRDNPVIRTLILSEIFVAGGFGLIGPIFAVYLTDYIQGGNLKVAGLASMIYLVTKALGQLPAAHIIDKIRGERDDFWAMLAGSIATSLVPLGYLVAQIPFHVYLLQFFYGLSQAFTFPSWLAIFTRHVDLNKEGFEWGIYYTLTDLSGALAAAIGGIIASWFGFAPLFLTVSLFSFIASGFLLLIRRETSRG